MIVKTTKAWELSLNLGTTGGWEEYEGTIYDPNDPYKEIMDRKHAIPRIFPGTHDGTPSGEPQMWSQWYLEKKRQSMGSSTFANQILLNPKLESVIGFDEDWIRYWPARSWKNLNTYIFVDPATSKKKESDYTVFFIIGMGADGNYYVVDIYRDKYNLAERTERLFYLHRKFRPLGVYYEKYGKDSDIEHYEDVMNRENYRFRIIPVGGKVAKEDRIEWLIPLFEEGKIFFPEECVRRDWKDDKVDLIKSFIYDEYIPYPFVKGHDDMLDCLSRIKSPEVRMVTPDETDFFDSLGSLDESDEREYNILEA
jgi:predicted phage terminase large subunit-like protein